MKRQVKRMAAVAIMGAIVGFAGMAEAQSYEYTVVTQTFASAESAAAAGWTAVTNDPASASTVTGWSNTDLAGGAIGSTDRDPDDSLPGEGRGAFYYNVVPVGRAYYADDTNVGNLSTSSATDLDFATYLYFNSSNQPNRDPGVGYFDKDTKAFFGFSGLSGANEPWQIKIVAANGTAIATSTAGTAGSRGMPLRLEVDWDPNGNGTITATLVGWKYGYHYTSYGTVTITLTEAQRNAWDALAPTFDSFGIFQPPMSGYTAGDGYVEFRIDNATYTQTSELPPAGTVIIIK